MELRNILKKCMINFLMIQAGITLSVGIIGCINPPPSGVSHYVFFMPFVYAFFCIFPSFVTYSKKELSIKQMAMRKVVQFLLIELVVMLISYIIGTLHDTFMSTAIMLAVAVIYAAVNFGDYLISKSDADAMTRKIQRIKRQEQEWERHE